MRSSMALEARLRASPGRPTRLVGAWGPRTYRDIGVGQRTTFHR